jgi:hypothetical protein
MPRKLSATEGIKLALGVDCHHGVTFAITRACAKRLGQNLPPGNPVNRLIHRELRIELLIYPLVVAPSNTGFLLRQSSN